MRHVKKYYAKNSIFIYKKKKEKNICQLTKTYCKINIVFLKNIISKMRQINNNLYKKLKIKNLYKN